jgi:HEAT repeat protein
LRDWARLFPGYSSECGSNTLATPFLTAAALAQVLGSDTNAVVRSQAAWALEKWGSAENLPALEKAAQTDASSAVRSRATITIDAIKGRK